LIVPAGDANALRAALGRLREDPALRHGLGGAGRSAAAAHTPGARAAGMAHALTSAQKRAPRVNLLMRRTVFLALLAALLFAPAAARASTDPGEIERDCTHDGVLQGSYSATDLRKARDSLSTDAVEYSDCRDVLSRAIAAKTSSSGGGGGGGGDASPTPAASAMASPDTTAEPSATAEAKSDSTVATDPGIQTGPTTPQDWKAVAAGREDGGQAVAMKGRDVSAMLAADVGRNGLPGTLLIALALLCVGCLVALLLPLRRRVTGNRT
jgi:opacity protein-like surface antigen